MQLSFRQKEHFFHALADLLRSGTTLGNGLEILSRSSSRIGRAAGKVRQTLEGGNSVSDAFRGSGFALSDVAVMAAGEASGRMVEVSQELEAYYQQLANARVKVIKKSAYPIFIFHLAIILLALPPAIMKGSGSFFANVIPALAGFYIAAFAVVGLWKLLRHAVATNPGIWAVLRVIPLLGGFLRDSTFWKFSSVLSLYIRAGGGLLKAFQASADSSGNAQLRIAAKAALEKVRAGAGLAEAFRQQAILPEELQRALDVGEQSGRLDEQTLRAAELFRDRTFLRLDAIAEWAPIILYVAVCVFTGIQIINMAMGMANSFNSVLDGVSQ